MAVSTGHRNGFSKYLGGGLEVEGFAGSGVEFVGDGVELGLGDGGEVRALGKILAQQTVGVFVAAALPGAVGIAEIDFHIGGQGKAGVAGQFGSPVPGQRGHDMARQALNLAGQGIDDILAGLGPHTHKHHKARASLDKGCDPRGDSAHQQVALPVARQPEKPGTRTVFHERPSTRALAHTLP